MFTSVMFIITITITITTTITITITITITTTITITITSIITITIGVKLAWQTLSVAWSWRGKIILGLKSDPKRWHDKRRGVGAAILGRKTITNNSHTQLQPNFTANFTAQPKFVLPPLELVLPPPGPGVV